MSLPALRHVPTSPAGWEKFHWNHWQDHKIILGVIAKKTNLTLFMPPIWPVPRNIFTAKIALWHQQLHEQMNAISKSPSSDMLNVDLSTPNGALDFVEPNYRDHYAFHQLIGIPN